MQWEGPLTLGSSPHLGDGTLTALEPRLLLATRTACTLLLHRLCYSGKAPGLHVPLLITSLLVCTQGEQGFPGVSGDPGFQGDKVILSDASSPTSTLILLA